MFVLSELYCCLFSAAICFCFSAYLNIVDGLLDVGRIANCFSKMWNWIFNRKFESFIWMCVHVDDDFILWQFRSSCLVMLVHCDIGVNRYVFIQLSFRWLFEVGIAAYFFIRSIFESIEILSKYFTAHKFLVF